MFGKPQKTLLVAISAAFIATPAIAQTSTLDAFKTLERPSSIFVRDARGIVQVAKFGPKAATYGRSIYSTQVVIDDYENSKESFLTDEIAAKYKELAASRGTTIKVYKTPLCKVVAEQFPRPANPVLELEVFQILDYCMLAFDNSNRLSSVLYRWFSVTGGKMSQPTWVQFSNVIEGPMARKVEDKLTASMLKDYELPQ